MELTLNSAAQSEQLSGIREFTYLVRATPGAIGFTIGEPDLNTPEAVKQAAKAALDANDTHYPPGNGYPATLEAISAFEEKEHGLRYSANEVILTDGATEALFVSFATVLNPGDEVIIPTPAFGLYEQTLDQIHAVLADRPIFVICDDVYRALVYSGEYHSFSEYQDMRDRIIVVQSFSKPYAMTGWRLGYLLADAPLRERLQVFHQYCVTSAPAFLQAGCVQALQEDVAGLYVRPSDRHGLALPGAGGRLLHLRGHLQVVDGLPGLCEKDAGGGRRGRHPWGVLRHGGICASFLLLLRCGAERGPGSNGAVYQDPVSLGK